MKLFQEISLAIGITFLFLLFISFVCICSIGLSYLLGVFYPLLFVVIMILGLFYLIRSLEIF